MTRLLTLIAVLFAFSFVPACRSSSGPPSGRAIPSGETRPPEDFALAVTVMGEEGTTNWLLQPARFVVEPDGVLRAATGAGVGPSVYPPRTRRLTQAQMNDLYAVVVRSGLDRGLGGEPYRLGETQPAGAWIVVEVTAHEQRRNTIYLPSAGREVVELVRQLRRLSRLES